jgi:hypothetical protein
MTTGPTLVVGQHPLDRINLAISGISCAKRRARLADAINHSLTRWKGLTRFIDDGRIERDNRQAIKPVAGSDGGAEHWVVIASSIETCKLNDVDPLAYLSGSEPAGGLRTLREFSMHRAKARNESRKAVEAAR